MPPESSPPAINPHLASIIKSRRTIGAFRPDRVPKEVVVAALDLARWAPNHKKTEPWHVIHLGPETINGVIELNSSLLRESKGEQEAESKRKKWSQVPGWLVVTCDLAEDAFRREEDYAACCCAVQNLLLVLWSAGVGTKWSTGEVTRHPDFYKLLNIDPAKQRTIAMIWYGYPTIVPDQTRHPVADFLRELP